MESCIKEPLTATVSPNAVSAVGLPRVLVVSNHWGVQKQRPFAGVFIDSQLASLRQAGVAITTFDIGTHHSPLRLVRKWFELRQEVRRSQPDLVHGQYGTLVGFMATLTGRPTVISFCGGDLLPGSSISSVRRRLGLLLSNLAALRAGVLICKSRELQKALWWRRSSAEIIPNGVDFQLFSPGPQDEARRQLGWDLQRPVVLFVNSGSDPVRKGLHLAEAAVTVAKARVPDAELFVVSHVKQAQMPLYYRAADVLLFASRREGSPNVVKEALACNLPVVSTPVGDVPQRLAGVYPSAVVARDARALGEAVAGVLLRRERCNGRERMSDLALDQIAERVIRVYQRAMRGT